MISNYNITYGVINLERSKRAGMILHRRQPTFQDFLEKIIDELDVPASQHASADKSYLSVAQWLSRPESSLRNLSPKVYVQGSFSLGTAIRPLTGDDEYDIDAVCEVDWDKNTYSQEQLKKNSRPRTDCIRPMEKHGRPQTQSPLLDTNLLRRRTIPYGRAPSRPRQ